MSYSLEISGIIAYADNTKSSFLAISDEKGNFDVRDAQVLNDAIPTIRTMLENVDATFNIPVIGSVNPNIKDIVVEINCSYTIGVSSYNLSILSSSLTGLLVEGSGSWQQFVVNYQAPFESLVRLLWPGSAVYAENMISPIKLRIINNSNYQQGITFRVYKKSVNVGAGLLILERFVGSSDQIEAFVYDFRNGANADRTFYCSAVRHIDPVPTQNQINTEISMLGIRAGDIVVTGGVSIPFSMTLNNIVFS